jgi:hypothetical protein
MRLAVARLRFQVGTTANHAAAAARAVLPPHPWHRTIADRE